MTGNAPCGWEVTRCGGCGTCWEDLAPHTRETASALAIGYVWAATGRQYGPCEVTVLPHNPPPAGAWQQTYPWLNDYTGQWNGSAWMTAALLGGQWLNLCGNGEWCACQTRCEVELAGPVASVLSVALDGVDVDPAAYEVHNKALLVRVDGSCWPTCQTWGLQVPGFSVTYERGSRIPANVQVATEALACEYAKALTGGDCALPQRLASLSRQGVQVTVAEVDRTVGVLQTGIRLVDDVINAVNPYQRSQRPVIVSPDMPTTHHRTITWMGGS